MISSGLEALISRNVALIPGLSIAKQPMVFVDRTRARVSGSSSGIESITSNILLNSVDRHVQIFSATSPRTVKPLVPSRSILINPILSIESRSNWVVTMPLAARWRGTRSVNGPGAITIPPGWTDRCRGKPRIAAASLKTA